MYRTYGTASTSHLWGDSIEVVTKYMLFMYYYVAVTNLSSRRICFVVLTEVFMEDFCWMEKSFHQEQQWWLFSMIIVVRKGQVKFLALVS